MANGKYFPDVSPLTGQFKNYTPYQVSLFTVSQASEVRHLSSVIGYSLQRRKYSCVLLFFCITFLAVSSLISPHGRWKINL